jgi:hypothetical protein
MSVTLSKFLGKSSLTTSHKTSSSQELPDNTSALHGVTRVFVVWCIQPTQASGASASSMGLFPGLAICLLAVGFNLLGDFLHDLLNPRLRDIGSG